MDWKIHNKKKVYSGHFNVTQFEVSHETFAGGYTPILKRELIGRNDAVAIVPYDPIADSVVLIEQFRIGAVREPKPWLMEVVAGLLEPGEEPEQVAQREAMEEIACDVTELIRIGEFYTSPGGLTEWVHLYIGNISVENISDIGGLADEGEDIKIHVVAADEIPLMISSGEIRSAIAIIGLQWFVANRENLRQQWMRSAN